MSIVSFKGTYQMNSVKIIDRQSNCSESEAKVFTQYMINKKLQEEWIKTNYPGAQTEKEISLIVNIK